MCLKKIFHKRLHSENEGAIITMSESLIFQEVTTMDKIFDTLKKLFEDIIGIVAGRNGEDGIATQVLDAIKNIFGNAAQK